MNENSSNTPSTAAAHRVLTAEAISRRAYELWEQEGRPENRDLHHWLRAEQQLLAEQGSPTGQSLTANPNRPANVDTQPLQGTRAAAANRDARPKRNTATPFNGTSGSTQPGARTATKR